MYEDKTYAAVLADAQAEVDTDVLKTEGSLTFNALSALAFEIEKLYTHMSYINDQMHASTADYEGLVMLCEDRNITPKEATSATVYINVVSGESAALVGKRFSLQGYTYTVKSIESSTEASGVYTVFTVATTLPAGSGPNSLTGAVTPVDHIDGFVSATIVAVIVDGEDAETQEELYERYLRSFGAEAYGGNIAGYREAVTAIAGVGGCKVYPVWAGASTVKIVVISSSYGTPSNYLIQQLETAADPTDDQAGYGFASIDHTVTIVPCSEENLPVSMTILTESGADQTAIRAGVNAALEAYLLELRKAWATEEYTDQTTVMISRVMTAVMSVTGVRDVTNVEVSGSSANYSLDWDAIPMLGPVTITFTSTS